MARTGLILGNMSIKLNEKNIAKMTLTPAGMVGHWLAVLTYEIRAEAMAETVTGTLKYGRGQLAKEYHVSMGPMTVSRSTFHLKNRKRYAAFVFRGTTGPIRSKSGILMPVGKSQLGLAGAARVPAAKRGKIKLKKAVRGQRGKNFPMRAAKKVFIARGLK